MLAGSSGTKDHSNDNPIKCQVLALGTKLFYRCYTFHLLSSQICKPNCFTHQHKGQSASGAPTLASGCLHFLLSVPFAVWPWANYLFPVPSSVQGVMRLSQGWNDLIEIKHPGQWLAYTQVNAKCGHILLSTHHFSRYVLVTLSPYRH